MPTCYSKGHLGDFFLENEFNFRSLEEIPQQEQEELRRREQLVQKLEQE